MAPGSNFGRTSFLIFVNDFPDVIISKLDNYADDSAILSCLNPKSDRFENAKFVVEWTESAL